MSDRELDRLRELASIGAGHAAGALAHLVGRTIRMRVPRSTRLDGSEKRPGCDLQRFATGTFFAVEGGIRGHVALLLPASSRELLVNQLLGLAETGLVPDGRAERSALQELGNILISSFSSAIGDALGKAVLPTIPTLAISEAQAHLATLSSELGLAGWRVECPLYDDAGVIDALLVWLPDAGTPGVGDTASPPCV